MLILVNIVSNISLLICEVQLFLFLPKTLSSLNTSFISLKFLQRDWISFATTVSNIFYHKRYLIVNTHFTCQIDVVVNNVSLSRRSPSVSPVTNQILCVSRRYRWSAIAEPCKPGGLCSSTTALSTSGVLDECTNSTQPLSTLSRGDHFWVVPDRYNNLDFEISFWIDDIRSRDSVCCFIPNVLPLHRL